MVYLDTYRFKQSTQVPIISLKQKKKFESVIDKKGAEQKQK